MGRLRYGRGSRMLAMISALSLALSYFVISPSFSVSCLAIFFSSFCWFARALSCFFVGSMIYDPSFFHPFVHPFRKFVNSFFPLAHCPFTRLFTRLSSCRIDRSPLTRGSSPIPGSPGSGPTTKYRVCAPPCFEGARRRSRVRRRCCKIRQAHPQPCAIPRFWEHIYMEFAWDKCSRTRGVKTLGSVDQ